MLKLVIYFFPLVLAFPNFFPPLGLLFLFLGFLLVLVAIANRKAKVLDDWSILIRNAQGQRGKVIPVTKELISDRKVPMIEVSEEKVGLGLPIVALDGLRIFL
jgi:hypothetical protein